MSQPSEFAEEYSAAERIRLFAIGTTVGAAFIVAWKFWLLPWFSAFAASAHCRSVFGIAGTTVLWYGLFVGFPLSTALILACTEGRHGLRILRDGRSPPTGAKVLRPTRIKRGAAARHSGYLHILMCTPFLAIAIWGSFQAASLSGQARPKRAACTASHSFKTATKSGHDSSAPDTARQLERRPSRAVQPESH